MSRVPVLIVVAIALSQQALAQPRVELPSSIALENNADARYPPRVADWIWTQPEYASFVPAYMRHQLEADIRKWVQLRGQKGALVELLGEVEDKIGQRLSKQFSVRDLTRGLEVTKNEASGLALCIRIDPKFTPEAEKTIRRAAALFLKVATEEAVVKAAFDDSIEDPTPIPEQYEMENGEIKKDRYGNPEITAAYNLMLKARTKPPSVEFFRTQVKEALAAANRDATPLVVSSFEGEKYDNKWWGAAWYGFYYTPCFRLQREAPSRGYFYIRLNEDRLKSGVDHHDDPAFWAGKLAHEMLHNLWYRHPAYTDPAMRDMHNPPERKAFIVAFEQAVAAAAEKELTQK